MRKFLSQYENENAKRFNDKVIKELRDEPLVPYIVDIFKSLESVPYIKYLGYEYENDYVKMDLNKINKKTTKMKITNDSLKLMNINESVLGRLTVKLRIVFKGKTKDIDIKVLLPEKYKQYYFYLNGKKYYPIYQLVDNSTYSSSDSLILKSILLQIIVKRKIIKDGSNNYVPMYYLNLFKREINLMLLYLAEFGFEKTLKYFDVDKDILDIENGDVVEYEGYRYIYSNNMKYVVKVDEEFYDRDVFIKNMVYLLVEIINSQYFNMSKIEDCEYWQSVIGTLFNKNSELSVEKGRNVLISFKRILDNITRKNLKLHPANKKDMFSVIKWMMTNFSELKTKNTLDMANKRLRLNEYIASYLSREISKKVNRILTRTKLNDIKYIIDNFNMKQDILITELQNSQLMRYDDNVNDIDLLSALRYSSKGPSSLGEKSSRTINMKYKNLHPSQIGRIDLNQTSNGSPGLTGTLCPFIQMDGMFFDKTQEVQKWEYEFWKMKQEINKTRHREYLFEFNIETEEDFYNMKEISDKILSEYKVKLCKKKNIVSMVITDTERIKIVLSF